MKAHPYQKILDQAKKDEKRYLLLLSRAEKLGLKEEFTKKNKGKQFKLRFVKKVWHLLFFRPIYDQRFEEQGHHKSFNITKEEFNDFSKWMFAFDEIPQYKTYLEELFRSKNFFTSDDFKQIFEEGHSLSDYYERTKIFFEKWINENSLNPIERKNNYSQILEKKIVYINLSHFIAFLEKTNKLQRDNKKQIIFKSTENTIYLISEWYYKDVLPREEYKVNAKLFNKLRKIKLEDALLYELAIRYLYTDKSIVKKAKANVDSILNSTVSFEIKNSIDEFLYNLLVPFNKLETLVVLIQHKRDQIKNRKTSFLTNLDPFIECIKDKDKNIKSIQENFKKKKELSFDDLTKINNYIISGSVEFSKVFMELERYFISKLKTQIHTNENRIDVEDIKDSEGRIAFKRIYDNYKEVRDKAYHFGVPQKSYKEVLLKMEKNFIEDEINPLDSSSFDELDNNIKTICRLFMNTLHHNLYKRTCNQNVEKNRKDFETKYFESFIANKQGA